MYMTVSKELQRNGQKFTFKNISKYDSVKLDGCLSYRSFKNYQFSTQNFHAKSDVSLPKKHCPSSLFLLIKNRVSVYVYVYE